MRSDLKCLATIPDAGCVSAWITLETQHSLLEQTRLRMKEAGLDPSDDFLEAWLEVQKGRAIWRMVNDG
jgi:hypothetical protein